MLIADEPTTALDVAIAKQILELIDDLRRQLGMAVILVTHDLGVIAGRADRVAVMCAGRVVETTTTAALFANPRHPYTEALFEALPEKSADAGPAGRRLYNIPGQPPDLTASRSQLRWPGRDGRRRPPSALVGPVFARLFFDRAEVTGAFIDTVVNQWLAALGSRYDHSD